MERKNLKKKKNGKSTFINSVLHRTTFQFDISI